MRTPLGVPKRKRVVKEHDDHETGPTRSAWRVILDPARRKAIESNEHPRNETGRSAWRDAGARQARGEEA